VCGRLRGLLVAIAPLLPLLHHWVAVSLNRARTKLEPSASTTSFAIAATDWRDAPRCVGARAQDWGPARRIAKGMRTKTRSRTSISFTKPLYFDLI
jgi:hypothetical protein